MSRKTLQELVNQIQGACGKESVMLMGGKSMNVKRLSSGILPLDIALGGGYPKGRILELSGAESAGKTTIALHAIAEAQRAGGICAFIDVEHAMNPEWAAKLGVNIADMLISQPTTGEEALELVDRMVSTGKLSLIVVDSVAALVPKAELEGDMDANQIGLQARLMSKAMRKLCGTVKKTGTIVLFINQIRYKIGGYGNPETTAGGKALRYFASIRMDVRRIATNKDGAGNAISNQIRIKVVKNKVAPPFKQVELELDFKNGISKAAVMIDLGVKFGIIKKAGSWFSYGNIRLGQGSENVKLFLKETVTVAEEIETKIMEKINV
jgi:recombination protein RecA